MIEPLLLWTLGIATIAQLGYWFFFFTRLAFYRPLVRKDPEQNRGVSVIICARNEAENLKKNLPLFLNQNYRSFEIIVVNDNSSDQTLEILLDFQKKNQILLVESIDTFTLPGKKAALKRGIHAAKNNILLFSDADCYPTSPEWLLKMQNVIQGETEIGLGYSPYTPGKGLLNHFIRFETVYTATQYLSFALAGIPYMGVGRNLIYTRSVFLHRGGFQSHLEIASGDDDLFVNEAATKSNTHIVLDPAAFVYSTPESSWKGYYYQKSRHLTTSVRYKTLHKVLLGGLSMSHFLHYTCAAAIWTGFGWNDLILMFYLVRIGVVVSLYRRILKKLNDKALIPWIPFLDAAFVLYYLLFAPVLIIGNQKSWK